MEYLKTWDVGTVVRQINSMSRECARMSKHTSESWNIKQDLYQIKFMVDQALKNCPKFPNEEEWVKEKKKKRKHNDIQQN